MRVSLDTGSLTSQDENRGIGVYARQLSRRLPEYVKLVTADPQIRHQLVFKVFAKNKLQVSEKYPTLVTVHDLIPLKYPQAYPSGLRGRLVWWQNKMKLRRADGIITDSRASKQDIVRFTGIDESKVQVVYLAADEIFKPGKAHEKFKLPKKFVLYVGDVNWNKNLLSLAKICLKSNYPLVVVGRQAVETDYDHHHPETAELVKFQKLAEKNPRTTIRLGVVTDRDLASIYRLATVYVQPSRDEGFGLPVLEALSCGCPVLSSGKGSLPEITGRAALSFNQNNLRLLWLSQSRRKALAAAGLTQAKKFSWAKTIKATVKVYEKIIADRTNR